MKLKFSFLYLSFVFLSACSFIGINLKHKAPAKAGKYPKFKEQDSLIGHLSHARDCYHPYYYELAVDFNVNEHSILGSSKMYLVAKEDFKTILLNLHEAMKIKTILWDGQSLAYNRKFTGLWVSFPNTIRKGEKIMLNITYEGKPQIARRPPWEGGFVWKKDKEKRPWLGVACEQVGANLWWPLKDHLTAEPDSMKMTFTVPKGLYCVSNGILINKTDSQEKTSFTYQVSYPINTYNVTFYIGNFEHFSLAYNKEEKKRLHFYVLDYNLEKAQTHLKKKKKIVQTFEKIYGEYPFWSDEFKLVESPYEGMEHQTAIAYGNGYKNNAMGIDYIVLHETAHEWWGNAISVKDYSDIWIHEGMATYSEALYFEENMGHETYLNYLNFYAMLIKNKKPMQGPKEVNYWNYKDSDPYMKGALMMHSLRSTLNNDTLFFSILKSFYSSYKHQTVCSEDFIRMVNEKTGRNYQWFFNKFLLDRKPAKLEYRVVLNPEDKNQTLYYKWTDVATDFVMPAEIVLSDGTHVKIYPETKEKSMVLSEEKPVLFDKRSAYYQLIKKKS
jgi:aminopeptidase N